jgi:hypothetical protein
MISQDKIAEAVRTLVDEAQPQKIVLFGSLVRGDSPQRLDRAKAKQMVQVRTWAAGQPQ